MLLKINPSARHYFLNIIRKILRKLVTRELRVLSESICACFATFTTKKIVITDFPIYPNGDVAFYKYPFLTTNGNQYFAQVYGQRFVTDVTVGKHAYMNYTSEIISGKLCKNHTNISVDSNSVIPISLINKSTDARIGELEITTDTGKLKLHNLKHNRFHYLPVPNCKNLSLYSDGNYIMGDPLPVKQTVKTKKKLVLTIFVDGLASEVLKNTPLEELMPNTYQYFDKGTSYYNGFANGSWTLPSVGSIVSGLYSINHGLYHNFEEKHIGNGYKIIGDYFKDSGYLTTQICSNHRKNPVYNYSQGFDRTLYRYSMGCEEIVTKALEQLRAFKDRSQYMWLTLFETHHFMHGIPDISNQISAELDLHNYGTDEIKSPFVSVDKNSTELYILELKRMDFYLKLLFDYVNDNYTDDEVVVSLCSDHGKSFLADETGLLAHHKVQVPMLFKSTDVSLGVCSNIVENVDFLPSLLDLSGIQYNPDVFDGKSLFSDDYDKKYAVSEVLYPNDYYYVAVYGDDLKFHIKSNKKLIKISSLDVYDCSYNLEDLNGNILETGTTSQLQSDRTKELFNYILRRRRHN
jgi:hypothetical protein